MIKESVECAVVYCAGWDPVAAAPVGRLAEGTARQRDADGAPYAVLLTAGTRPLVLVEVCWASHHAAVWLFDERRRRHAVFEYRRLGPLDGQTERLALLTGRQWRYAEDSVEFDDSVPVHRIHHSGEESGDWPADEPVLAITKWVRPLPPFGAWARLARVEDLLTHPVTLTVAADPATETPAEPPWRPPVPLRPRLLDEIFRQGTEFTDPDLGAVEVDVTAGPELWLPSGRLIVADPDPWLAEADVFVDAVEPGKYPVTVAVARAGNAERVAAVKIVLSEAPVVSWAPALRDGEEPRMLGDGEFYGVAVEDERVALVDAETAELFEDVIEDHPDTGELVDEVPEPESGANLVTVRGGAGFYPVWTGRAADGSLSCFVVDFLVLDRAHPAG